MKTIWIVEDDDNIRELLNYIFRQKDIKHRTFSLAKPFLTALGEMPLPDVILLDVMLPDGNGIQLCRTIKSEEGKNRIPVMLVSAHVNLQEDSADDFMAKPFDIEKLLSRVTKLVH